jgi:hypothetical protein
MKKGFQERIERLWGQFDLSRIVRYLKDREKKGGGFSFASELYPILKTPILPFEY